MHENADVIAIVGEWVAKAENDLRTAVHTLKIQRDCPTDTICFHAQQSVEKYLKALPVLQGTPIPKTHNLFEICDPLPDAWRPDLPPQMLQRLTVYATVSRYPGDYDPIELAEARQAVRAARLVRLGARALIPKAALRRQRSK